MDINVNYYDEGQGQALVMLHGNNEDHTYFREQFQYFKDKYRVIAPDTRGHGKTERGTGTLDFNQIADDLKAFLDELGVRDIILLGFSDGGNTALTFALKYPEYIDKLIINGANLYPMGVKFLTQLPTVIQYGGLIVASMFNKRYTPLKEIIGLMVVEPHISPKKLKSLTMSTLVIAGNRDMIKTSHTELIARSIPNSKLIIIPGDHFIAKKNPTLFNKVVEDFLNS